eukprot:2931530-Rhodomonas_salina.2
MKIQPPPHSPPQSGTHAAAHPPVHLEHPPFPSIPLSFFISSLPVIPTIYPPRSRPLSPSPALALPLSRASFSLGCGLQTSIARHRGCRPRWKGWANGEKRAEKGGKGTDSAREDCDLSGGEGGGRLPVSSPIGRHASLSGSEIAHDLSAYVHSFGLHVVCEARYRDGVWGGQGKTAVDRMEEVDAENGLASPQSCNAMAMRCLMLTTVVVLRRCYEVPGIDAGFCLPGSN